MSTFTSYETEDQRPVQSAVIKQPVCAVIKFNQHPTIAVAQITTCYLHVTQHYIILKSLWFLLCTVTYRTCIRLLYRTIVPVPNVKITSYFELRVTTKPY